MNNNTLTSWLRLTNAPGVGSRCIQKLLARFHTIEEVCSASAKQLSVANLRDEQIKAITHPDQPIIDETVLWLSDEQHHFIPFTDSRYPALLLETSSFPAVLYVHGEYQLLSEPQIAVVGSRKPTHTGLEVATDFSRELANAGLYVTSGLALGIDGAAHAGALSVNKKTIAILGSGLKNIYPKQHAPLYEQIVQKGCAVSELPLHTAPVAQNFPRRNRIISGLSLGVLIIEAAPKSGSLITARFALEQNRDVFAVPGSLRNPMAKGCLSLIQEGAKCVTQISDILNEIAPMRSCTTPNAPSAESVAFRYPLDSNELQVLACIEDVTGIDQICTRSKLSIQQVTGILLKLEVQDIVKRHHNGYVRIK